MLNLRLKLRAQAGGNPPPADPTALPADLVACIESASVIPRHDGADGALRAVVQIDGRGWVHTVEDTRAQLLRRWPLLTEPQVARAVRHIGAKVRQASAERGPQRIPFIHRY